MKELLAVMDEYLDRYQLNVVNAARILILAVGMMLAVFVRGKAQKTVMFTALLAFTLTFIPEIITLVRLISQDMKKR